MEWEKLGNIYNAARCNYNLNSHAALPFVQYLCGDLFRVYFSARNENNQSATFSLEFNISEPNTILLLGERPLLTSGDLGTFDDSGAMGNCILKYGKKLLLYYQGWNLGKTVPFRNSIGLAISEDNGVSFQKKYLGPIMDRTKDEPFFVASCFVLKDDNSFKMWYLSCTGWDYNCVKEIVHRYHIKYAESADAINWNRTGTVAIDYKNEFEYAISTPVVLKRNGIYQMWYSFRAQKNIDTYRIGYAESLDGINWTRKDEEVGIDVSEYGWDSEMICYPHVFEHKEDLYMLYNGNGFGKTGFGLAKLKR